MNGGDGGGRGLGLGGEDAPRYLGSLGFGAASFRGGRLRDESLDALVDACEQTALSGEIARYRDPLSRQAGDGPFDLAALTAQLRLASGDLALQVSSLMRDLDVLHRNEVGGVRAVDQVAQARRADENIERPWIRVDVQGVQALLEIRLRGAEIAPRDAENALVRAQG